MNEPESESRTCRCGCGRTFEPSVSWQKYASDECRHRAFRDRRKEQVVEEIMERVEPVIEDAVEEYL